MTRILGALLLLLLTSCGGAHTVTYEVTSPQRMIASLVYRNAQGDMAQEAANTPWSLSFEAPAGKAVGVSARSRGAAGRVVCRILIDGTEVQRIESESTAECAVKV